MAAASFCQHLGALGPRPRRRRRRRGSTGRPRAVIGRDALSAFASSRRRSLARRPAAARRPSRPRFSARRRSAPSVPSVTSTPILRPSMVFGAFFIRLSAGEGFMSIGGRAGVNLFRLPFHPEPLFDPRCTARRRCLRVAEHAPADRHGRDLAQLERERADDVPLLGLGHRAPEQPRLAVVVGEGLRALALCSRSRGRPPRPRNES